MGFASLNYLIYRHPFAAADCHLLSVPLEVWPELSVIILHRLPLKLGSWAALQHFPVCAGGTGNPRDSQAVSSRPSFLLLCFPVQSSLARANEK